jgi:hypothetical protein
MFSRSKEICLGPHENWSAIRTQCLVFVKSQLVKPALKCQSLLVLQRRRHCLVKGINVFPTIIAIVMHELNAMQTCGFARKHHSFVETFSLKKGLKKFGARGRTAASIENDEAARQSCIQAAGYLGTVFRRKRNDAKSHLSNREERRYHQGTSVCHRIQSEVQD